MISLDSLVLSDASPIYQQIVLFLKRGMAAGTVLDGDELPSRRTVSALLGVNPNTIQKAYRILEEEGLIVSHSGAKSFVQLGPGRREQVRDELLGGDLQTVIRAMKQSGVSKEEALALLDRFWEVEP